MATDTLSDVLKTVRLTGAAYFDVAAQDPWSVHSPSRELILPRILPGADHLTLSTGMVSGLVATDGDNRRHFHTRITA